MGSRGDVGLAPAQVVRPDMWMDVVIVALLLGVGVFLNRADWHRRFLTRMRTAARPWVKAAHDAVTPVGAKRVRPRRSRLAPGHQFSRAAGRSRERARPDEASQPGH